MYAITGIYLHIYYAYGYYNAHCFWITIKGAEFNTEEHLLYSFFTIIPQALTASNDVIQKSSQNNLKRRSVLCPWSGRDLRQNGRHIMTDRHGVMTVVQHGNVMCVVSQLVSCWLWRYETLTQMSHKRKNNPSYRRRQFTHCICFRNLKQLHGKKQTMNAGLLNQTCTINHTIAQINTKNKSENKKIIKYTFNM